MEVAELEPIGPLAWWQWVIILPPAAVAVWAVGQLLGVVKWPFK